MEITITRALAQVKNLDKRIEKKIEEFSAVTYVKNSSDVVLDGAYTREEFAKKQQSELQSIKDLIKLRKQIKAKIVHSNANTRIMVGEQVYTVAAAIERKNTIELEEDLLERLQARLRLAQSFVNKKNGFVEDNALSIIQSLASKDKSVKLEDNKLAQDYINENSYSILDPINIKDEIDNLEEEINAFKTNVDFALSESNAITTITIDEL